MRNYGQQVLFTTKDGATIRSLLDLSNAPVRNQSLADQNDRFERCFVTDDWFRGNFHKANVADVRRNAGK